jgi:SAM-dependent methyltransferase
MQEDRYRSIFKNQRNSPTLQSIWSRIYGDNYPAELEPFGFITRTELRYLGAHLGISAGSLLVDLCCGRGGPGLWAARETESALVSLDIVTEAVADAKRRATASGPAHHHRGFLASSCAQIALRSDTFDAAMSVDAFWMIRDKMAALREISRILRPGARFVCATWQPTYYDYEDLLVETGFRDVVIWSSPDWLGQELAVYKEIVRNRNVLVVELGQDAADILITEALEAPAALRQNQRLIICSTNTA